ncbi:hypothetical protein ACFLQY_04595 [Verrucomicrobiota bacterium]
MADQFLSLSQKQELQQVLAPHLRQSLEVLQVPILELRSLVQKRDGAKSDAGAVARKGDGTAGG